MVINWTLKTVKVEDIYENQSNPRRITKQQAEHLQKSLTKFGVCQPVVVNRSGKIIGGHQRYAILKRMGEKKINVCMPDRDLDKREEEELSIRLNKNTGEWNFDSLANNFDLGDLCSFGFSLEELGFTTPKEEISKETDEKKITVSICSPENMTDEIEQGLKKVLALFEPTITYKIKVKP